MGLILDHDIKKEWWDKALITVSLTNSWTSTHVGYMGWQAVRRAKASGRYDLDNENEVSNPHAPAPLEADCQEYLETISVLSPKSLAHSASPFVSTPSVRPQRHPEPSRHPFSSQSRRPVDIRIVRPRIFYIHRGRGTATTLPRHSGSQVSHDRRSEH